MTIAATSLAQTYVPVTPASPVRAVGSAEQRRTQAAAQPVVVLSAGGLQQARAAALAELAQAPDAEDTNTTRYLGLDRDQLAAMVFDRNEVYSLSERRSAQRQLQTNDNAYLGRATELSEISGDDRVLLNAKLQLERSKSTIERAVAKSDAVDMARLQQRIAERTDDLGGGRVAISLRYPNGWASSGEALPLPAGLGNNKVSPGATRMALLYRESLF